MYMPHYNKVNIVISPFLKEAGVLGITPDNTPQSRIKQVELIKNFFNSLRQINNVISTINYNEFNIFIKRLIDSILNSHLTITYEKNIIYTNQSESGGGMVRRKRTRRLRRKGMTRGGVSRRFNKYKKKKT